MRLNATHYFIMKINKRELQQIASNHSSDTDFKYVMNLYKDYNKEPFSFLVNGTPLPSDNPLRSGRAYYKMTISEKVKQFRTKSSKAKFRKI